MMRYFINPETGLTFALPESEAEKWLVKPPLELVELDMGMFRAIFGELEKPENRTEVC